MATKNPDNVKTRKGKEGDTYYENTALAGRLKGKGVNVKAGPVSSDRTQRKATNMAKRKEYASKRSSTPVKRTTTAGNTTQNGSYGNAPASPPPAQTFAQNGQTQSPSQYRPMMPQYGFDAMPPGQPMQQQQSMQPRPSAFGQPNSAMTMGIQPMGNPYMNSQNPAQMMGGYQPPMGNPNPWGRRW